MADGNFSFTINLGGNVFTGVAQIDSLMNNLSATVNKQESFWNKLNTTAFKFNNLFQSAKTIISSVTNTLNGFESAYNIQNQAEIKLATVMRQRTGATDEQIESIKRLASAQQALGVIGDEVQLSGAQQLATFITQKNSIDTLLPAMNNLLAQQKGINATEGDAVNIGNLMGKVMQGQTSALTRVGITFSEAEEKVLKYGTEQQRAAMLAQVITNNVGEMNKALAQTPEGALKQHANTMGDLQERVGKVYVNIKAALLPVFDMISQKLEVLIGWLEANFATISAVFMGIANVVRMAFGIVWGIVSGVISVFLWLWNVINAGLPLIAGLTVAIGGWAVVMNWAVIVANLAALKIGFLSAMTKAFAVAQRVAAIVTKEMTMQQLLLNVAFAVSPIGMFVALIAGLAVAVTLCWNKFAGFRAFLITMWDTIKQFGGIIKDYIVDRIVGIIRGIGSLGSAIAKLFTGDFSGAWEAAKSGVKDIIGVDAAKKAAGSASQVVGGIKEKYSQNLEKERAKDADKKKSEVDTDPNATPDFDNPDFAGAMMPSASPIGDSVSGIGSQAAADNGGKIKNINVTIEKVVENFTVTTTNLREDASRIKGMVADALVGAVNDLNYAL